MTKKGDGEMPAPSQATGSKGGFQFGEFLQRWGTWIAIAGMLLGHGWLVLTNIEAGVHEVLPAYTEMEVGSVEAWIDTIPRLFFKPQTVFAVLRMYSLWIFFYVFLCIYGAMRVGDSIPRGVLTLVSVCLAVIVLLLVVTPAAWILFGDRGPLAVEIVPLVILGGIAMLLEFSTRRMMIED
ncbi:MAG: hypothetical protein ACLFS8_05450 [Clostridia bacterium]